MLRSMVVPSPRSRSSRTTSASRPGPLSRPSTVVAVPTTVMPFSAAVTQLCEGVQDDGVVVHGGDLDDAGHNRHPLPPPELKAPRARLVNIDRGMPAARWPGIFRGKPDRSGHGQRRPAEGQVKLHVVAGRQHGQRHWLRRKHLDQEADGRPDRARHLRARDVPDRRPPAPRSAGPARGRRARPVPARPAGPRHRAAGRSGRAGAPRRAWRTAAAPRRRQHPACRRRCRAAAAAPPAPAGRAGRADPPGPRPPPRVRPPSGWPAGRGGPPSGHACARSAAWRRTRPGPPPARTRSTRAAPGSSEVTPSTWMAKTACAANTSSAPQIHSQAGRLRATRASSHPVPRTDQSTDPPAPWARRSHPTAMTAASAIATATAASGRVRPPARALGTSHSAAASSPSRPRPGPPATIVVDIDKHLDQQRQLPDGRHRRDRAGQLRLRRRRDRTGQLRLRCRRGRAR